MHKAKQSQDQKKKKILMFWQQKKHRAESDKSSWFAHPSEKSAGRHVFFLFFLISTRFFPYL